LKVVILRSVSYPPDRTDRKLTASNKTPFSHSLWKRGAEQGPWGILGHRMDADVKLVMEGNLEGLKFIMEN
jgi:hypothetical protein